MNILFVSGESKPFAKTGGLADVVFSLSKEMVKKGNEVSVCIPLYKSIKDSNSDLKKISSFKVKMNWRMQDVDVYETIRNGVKFYFIGCAVYFNREHLYSYEDDIERFALFDLATVEFVKKHLTNLDIVHVHDWQAGMVPLLLKVNKIKVKTVLTIHNPMFQGNFSPDYIMDYFNLPRSFYDEGTMRFNNYCSFLKTAIVTTDVVTTVSVTHAKELREDKTSYNGLGNIIALRGNRFVGIVNGIDEDEFNPTTDKYIAKKYDIYSFKESKKENLVQLQKRFDYTRIPKGPVVGVVTRLTPQKGIIDIIKSIPLLVTYDMQVFIVGEGDRDLENELQKQAEKYPNHIKFYKGYSDELAHIVYAASDFFLMPSVFEPCGIGQLVAMRYGTLPIVRRVGGLNDTVTGYELDKDRATGFSFDKDNDEGLQESIKLAYECYKKENMVKIILNAMKFDSSWSKSVDNYLSLYKDII